MKLRLYLIIMKHLILFAAIALTVVSCNNADQEAIDKSLIQETPNPVTEGTQNPTTTSGSLTPEVILPDSLIDNPEILKNMVPLEQAKAAAAPVTTASGLNPEHGKPGHRCDIPVGAPLSTPPTTKPASQITNNTPVQVTPTITPKATPVATPTTTQTATPNTLQSGAKVNPAHGQPGHRCDIPVGSPL